MSGCFFIPPTISFEQQFEKKRADYRTLWDFFDPPTVYVYLNVLQPSDLEAALHPEPAVEEEKEKESVIGSLDISMPVLDKIRAKLNFINLFFHAKTEGKMHVLAETMEQEYQHILKTEGPASAIVFYRLIEECKKLAEHSTQTNDEDPIDDGVVEERLSEIVCDCS
jgi:hypothetical protein